MPSLLHRLKLLRREAPHAVSVIVASALRHAEPQERDALGAAALSTGRPGAVAAVIGCLHDLGPSIAMTLRTAQGSLEPAVRAVCRTGDRQAVLNAVGLARQRADVALLGSLVGLLASSLEDVGPAAARAVLSIVVAHLGPEGRRRVDPAVADRIDLAVLAAASSYHRHRRVDALLAAALLAHRRGTRVGRLLDTLDDALLFPLRGVVARPGERLVRANMLRWLTSGALGGQVCRWMHTVGGAEATADLLGAGHLLLAPDRRRALRRVERPARCVPDLEDALGLPSQIQISAVRLIGGLPISASLRRDLLADWMAMDCPVAKLGAMSLLGAGADPASQRAVESLCFDHDEAVAYVAARRFMGASAPAAPQLRRLERCPHRIIARRAARQAAPGDVEAYFARWLHLSRSERVAAALRLLAETRRPMLAGLAGMVARGSRAEKTEAMVLARRLRLTTEIEAALISQATGGDDRVTASAIAAIGDVVSARRLELVTDALEHDDARVRANAVEAIMRMNRRATSHLGELVTSHDNRLRANAVRALLRARRAAGTEALRAMLADRDPRHRVSALWVARRARARTVARDLRRLARRDRFTEIRSRARSAAQLIEACNGST